ncbi:MAG: hypothetical protein GF355_11835 [Candidatus Eisenbacteria bacterium]|nr:hypothetical protein [Candidatus Eisenbacteria bacterium]
MRKKNWAPLVALAAISFGAMTAQALVEPFGDILVVNDSTTGQHKNVHTVANGANQVLWVWQGEGSGDDAGIFGKVTSDWIEFRLNEKTLGTQTHPTASWDPTGQTFVAVWESDPNGIIGRRFDLYGAPLTDDFAIAEPSGDQEFIRPVVKHDPEGNLVIAWQEDDAGKDAIWVGVFEPDGQPLLSPVQASTNDNPKQPVSLEVSEDGYIVVAWAEQNEDDAWRLHASTLEKDLTLVAQDFTGFGLGGNQAQPDIEFINEHEFLLLWYQGAGWAQVVEIDGDLNSAAFQISSTGAAGQSPAIDRGESGRFVAAWKNDDGIGLRCLDEEGAPLGPDFLIDPPTPAYQVDLTFNQGDFFVVSWSGDSEGSAISDVYTQQWQPSTAGAAPAGSAGLQTLWSRPLPSVFAEGTTIEYALGETAGVSLGIYDVHGRVVRTLVDGTRHNAGIHRADWDGRDAGGAPAPNGVYFYRVEAGDRTALGRVLRIK